MTVTLTWYEEHAAIQVGVLRHVLARKEGRRESAGNTKAGIDGLMLHLNGALGECALAKALGVYWNGSVNTFKTGGDVGRVQVRTRSRPDYQLYVRPDDRDADLFVLVRGCYEIVGCIHGRDAKRPEWLKEHGARPAAYFVPDRNLAPVTLEDGRIVPMLKSEAEAQETTAVDIHW